MTEPCGSALVSQRVLVVPFLNRARCFSAQVPTGSWIIASSAALRWSHEPHQLASEPLGESLHWRLGGPTSRDPYTLPQLLNGPRHQVEPEGSTSILNISTPSLPHSHTLPPPPLVRARAAPWLQRVRAVRQQTALTHRLVRNTNEPVRRTGQLFVPVVFSSCGK